MTPSSPLNENADSSAAGTPARQTIPKFHVDETTGDTICEHGTAADVHCCNCHNGFIFDPDHVCEEQR